MVTPDVILMLFCCSTTFVNAGMHPQCCDQTQAAGTPKRLNAQPGAQAATSSENPACTTFQRTCLCPQHTTKTLRNLPSDADGIGRQRTGLSTGSTRWKGSQHGGAKIASPQQHKILQVATPCTAACAALLMHCLQEMIASACTLLPAWCPAAAPPPPTHTHKTYCQRCGASSALAQWARLG